MSERTKKLIKSRVFYQISNEVKKERLLDIFGENRYCVILGNLFANDVSEGDK